MQQPGRGSLCSLIVGSEPKLMKNEKKEKKEKKKKKKKKKMKRKKLEVKMQNVNC